MPDTPSLDRLLATPFPEWTLEHARAFVGTLKDPAAVSSKRFYEGDGWQGGQGWMSVLPTGDGSAEKVAAVRRLFVHEPLIAEAVNNHRDGVLGREPLWRFVKGRTPRSPRRPAPPPSRSRLRLLSPPGSAPQDPPQPRRIDPPSPPVDPKADADDPRAVELEEQLTDKWDEQETLDTFREALVNALFFRRAPLRLYVPLGLRGEGGVLSAGDFAGAIRLLYLEAPDPQAAGVYVDPDTKRECGVYWYTNQGQEFAEITYLDEGTTVLRVLSGDGVVGDEWRGDLGGRLLMFEIRRSQLIGESERRNQVVGNYAKSLMARGLEMGGFRERNYLNVQAPGYWIDAGGNPWVGDPEHPRDKFVTVPLPTGPGTDRFLVGSEMNDPATGEFKGYASPSLAYEDPVPLSEPERGLQNARLSILSSTGQLYLAMTGDGAAAAVARIQARAVHETRLAESKTKVDSALRWYLEAEARFGVLVSGQPAVNDLRAEANAIVDTGPLTPDEQRAIVERMEKGYLSPETGLALLGHDDPEAELARIRAAKEEADAATLRVVNSGPPQDPAAALQQQLAQMGQGQQRPGQANDQQNQEVA